MAPQLGVGGGSPRPRKDSEASAMMVRATEKVVTTMRGGSTLGKRCRVTTWRAGAPSALAAAATPAAGAQHENHVGQARPEHGDDGHAEKEDRKGELDVPQAHEEIVRPAPAVAGDEPPRHAHPPPPRDEDGGDSPGERDARPVQEPAQHVAPEGVGAEGMARAPALRPHGRREPIEEAILHGVGRRQRGREGRHHHRGGDDAEPGQRGQIAAPAHESRTRGGSAVESTYTVRVTATKITAKTKTPAWITGKSRPGTAWTMRRPSPGQEKTVSMMMAPLSMKPSERPVTVSTGKAALRSAWR